MKGQAVTVLNYLRRVEVKEFPSDIAYTITEVERYQTVKLISEEKEWAEVKVGKKIGYIESRYLEKELENGQDMIVTCNEAAELKEEPNETSETIKHLKNNEYITIVSTQNIYGDWVKVKIDKDIRGFILKENLKHPHIKQGIIKSNSKIDVRDNNNTTSSIIAKLENNNNIEIINEHNNHYEMNLDYKTFGSTKGFISKQHIEIK